MSVISLVIVILCIGLVNGMKKPKETFVVLKEIVPYISCDVCQKAVAEIYALTVEARKNAFKNRLDEVVIVENLDYLCKPDNKTAKWIRKQDIIEENVSGGKLLRLIEPGEVSKCKEECVTIAKSCELLFEEEIEDRDDLSAILWKNKHSVDELQELVCKKWTNRCKNNKNKYLPSKFKYTDHEFEAMSAKDVQMEEMMAQMEGSGLGNSMSMYNRDDMASMMGGGGVGYGDEDGDDMYGGGYGEGGYDGMPEF